MPPARQPFEERFDRLYQPEPNSGCWLWTGAVMKNGYGVFGRYGEGSDLAHRYSYERFKGPVEPNMDLDHLCRVRCCVNPDHLEAVSRRENLGRSPIWNGSKTHCKNGHEFTVENTWLEKSGARHCRTCHKLKERARRYRLKGI